MLKQMSRAGSPLMVTAGLVLIALPFFLAGLAVDSRVITGAPAWLKPAKFAMSIAIYSVTLAWMFTFIPDWTRTRRIVGWTTAVTLLLEMVIIGGQAWRGTSSHFNIGTPIDAVLWTTMGVAIVVQTLTSVAVAVAVWRQRFEDEALGWAIRLGLVITIVGASAGGLMTRPTASQLNSAASGQPLRVVGAHTVGAPDGGPGLPGTGWSISHGDLRVAHFMGLHALQAIPLLTLVLLPRRRVNDAVRIRLTKTAAVSYAGLFAILLWQALRGQSILTPDPLTIAAIAAWGVGTAAASAGALTQRMRLLPHAVAR